MIEAFVGGSIGLATLGFFWWLCGWIDGRDFR